MLFRSTKAELLELIKDIEDGVDVTEQLQGIEGVATTVEVAADLNNITLDDYKSILESNKIIQGYNQSQIDSHVSKGVESFKKEKMQRYIDDAVKLATTPQDETPEQFEPIPLPAKL